jgi:hypothetical protein
VETPQRGAAVALAEPSVSDRSQSSPERATDDLPAPANWIDRSRQLEMVIRQRIEQRLPGRVRNLAVRVIDDTVLLEGQCATYYTKQLAQHAAMGVLQNEHLENAIIVAVAQR